MKVYYLVFFFSFSFLRSYTQIVDYKINLDGIAQFSTESESPFWMHMNRNGLVDEKSHFSGVVTPLIRYNIDERSSFEIGLGALVKDGYEDDLRLDQAYFSYISPKFALVVGKKHKSANFQGLSAANENILVSRNAPAIPGIRLFTPEPIFPFNNYGLGFRVALEEYLLDDDRYVDDTRLHHKSFHLVYHNKNNFKINLGVQHFVQWAGVSSEYGQLPNTFNDYVRIITGMSSDEVGDQEVNALGNQIGSYEINVKSKINDLDVEFIYNHIFEDASGMKMGNFPDGRYGLYVEDNRDSFWGTPWLTAFMYELYYTKNQSRGRVSSLVDGADNYFNNNLYRSGWTYNNRVIGVPFILLNDNRFRIGTNILTVHHLGMRGQLFEKLPYRFLLSYRKNYGVKDSFFEETSEVFSTLLEVELVNSDYQLKALLGADIKSHDNSNFGIGVNFSKTIF